MKKYFIDLFAGCGGLSLGLEQAGFTPAFVNELNGIVSVKTSYEKPGTCPGCCKMDGVVF